MHSRRWSPALVCPRGPVGDSGQSPHQVTQRPLWETVSLGLPGHSGETLGTPRRPTNREPPRDPPRMDASSPLRAARRRHCSWFYLMAEKSQARANCCLTAFASEPKTVGAMVDTTMSGYRLADLACCANLCFPRAPTLPLCPQSRKRNCLRVKGGTRKA